MKRLLRSWVFWAFVAAPVVLVGVRLQDRQVGYRVCSRCYSERIESRWRIGHARIGFWPLPFRSESLYETRVYLDGWSCASEHRWGWSISGQHSPGRYDVPEGLLASYQHDPAFRAFMLAKRDAGELSSADVVDALERPYRVLLQMEDVPLQTTAQRRHRFSGWRDGFERSGAAP